VIWKEESRLIPDNKNITYDLIKGSNYKNSHHSVFYIPAQRVTLRE
jgi:hypothetical protein